MEQVRLPELETIKRFSIAVRKEHAARDEVIAALKADLAAIQSGALTRRVEAPAPQEDDLLDVEDDDISEDEPDVDDEGPDTFSALGEQVESFLRPSTRPSRPAARKPVKKTAVKKAAVKKSAAKKSTAKRTTASKTASRKTGARKTASRKKPAARGRRR